MPISRDHTFQPLQTLAANVIILLKYYPAVSMVVVDFNESEDELLTALLHYYKLPLSMGVLHYFRAPRPWHASSSRRRRRSSSSSSSSR